MYIPHVYNKNRLLVIGINIQFYKYQINEKNPSSFNNNRISFTVYIINLSDTLSHAQLKYLTST